MVFGRRESKETQLRPRFILTVAIAAIYRTMHDHSSAEIVEMQGADFAFPACDVTK